MRIFSYALATVGVVASAALFALNYNTPSSTNLVSLEDQNTIFSNYVAKFGKRYGTKEEFQFRMEQYFKNLQEAKASMDENSTFTIGENHLTDWTPEEYRRLLGYKKTQEIESIEAEPFEAVSIPAAIDWREKNAVTVVKDQGQCGSCWAFSTIGTLEGTHARLTGDLKSLSEQQVVDCARLRPYGNLGCNGGQMKSGIQYATDSAIVLESTYPYKGVQASS